MWWAMFNTRKKNKEDAKKAIMKAYFSASAQKKAIKKAARESAVDQRKLVEKYHELLKADR